LLTPLAAIEAALSTLEVYGERLRPADRAELVATALSRCRRSSTLVVDLLDVSRIEAGVRALERVEVDLVELALEVAGEVDAKEEATAVRIVADGPVRASVDPSLMREVLWNLFDNAVRHGPIGDDIEVLVRAERACHRRRARPRAPRAFGRGARAARLVPHRRPHWPHRPRARHRAQLPRGPRRGAHRRGGTLCHRVSMLDPTMPARRLLIIDDDPALARVLAIGLGAAGYAVTAALRGTEGLARAVAERPDIVVVDLGLPDVDGVSVVGELRRFHRGGLLVLSAVHDERTKVAALDAGADDYVTKPFGILEFQARLRALERRMERPMPAADRRRASGRLVVDVARRILLDDEMGEIVLSRREFDVLRYLAAHQGRVVTHRMVLEALWGPGYDDPHHLRVVVSRIRAKLGPAGEPLRSVPGVGYEWRP